jgi:hypothetical protein
MRVVVLLAMLSACQSSEPTCAKVGERIGELMAADPQRGELRAAFVRRCEQDRWNAEMKSCVIRTKSLTEPQNCRTKLDAEQAKQLDTELAKLESLPDSCAAYEQLVKSAQGCEELSAEVRAALAEQLAGHQRIWATLEDKQSAAGTCAAGIAALRQSAPSCFTPKR